MKSTTTKQSLVSRQRALHDEIQAIEKAAAGKIHALHADADRNRRDVTREATEHAARNKREADARLAKIVLGCAEARRAADKARAAAVAKSRRGRGRVEAALAKVE